MSSADRSCGLTSSRWKNTNSKSNKSWNWKLFHWVLTTETESLQAPGLFFFLLRNMNTWLQLLRHWSRWSKGQLRWLALWLMDAPLWRTSQACRYGAHCRYLYFNRLHITLQLQMTHEAGTMGIFTSKMHTFINVSMHHLISSLSSTTTVTNPHG